MTYVIYAYNSYLYRRHLYISKLKLIIIIKGVELKGEMVLISEASRAVECEAIDTFSLLVSLHLHCI